LPIIVTGSEDGTVRLWHSSTYRAINVLNYGMERIWSLGYLKACYTSSAYTKGCNEIALGYDEGTITIRLGREEPAISMDNNGKLVYAKNNEIMGASIKTDEQAGNLLVCNSHSVDGRRVQLSPKDLGNSEIYPQNLLHSPNSRFIAIQGDGEYIIYTALAWRNKAFGKGLDFVWSADSEYAVRENVSCVRIFKGFVEREFNVRLSFASGIASLVL